MTRFVIDGYVDKLQQRLLQVVDETQMVPHSIKFTEAQFLQLYFKPLLGDLQETRPVWPDSVNMFFVKSTPIVELFTKAFPFDYALAPFA